MQKICDFQNKIFEIFKIQKVGLKKFSVRLQAGKTSGNRVIQYCNGLMDHVICCRDPKGKRLALDCLSKVSKSGCQNEKCGSKSAANCRLGICFSQPLHSAKCIYIEECSKKKFAPTVSKPSKLPW